MSSRLFLKTTKQNKINRLDELRRALERAWRLLTVIHLTHFVLCCVYMYVSSSSSSPSVQTMMTWQRLFGLVRGAALAAFSDVLREEVTDPSVYIHTRFSLRE